jgi:hypothetical protein
MPDASRLTAAALDATKLRLGVMEGEASATMASWRRSMRTMRRGLSMTPAGVRYLSRILEHIKSPEKLNVR